MGVGQHVQMAIIACQAAGASQQAQGVPVWPAFVDEAGDISGMSQRPVTAAGQVQCRWQSRLCQGLGIVETVLGISPRRIAHPGNAVCMTGGIFIVAAPAQSARWQVAAQATHGGCQSFPDHVDIEPFAGILDSYPALGAEVDLAGDAIAAAGHARQVGGDQYTAPGMRHDMTARHAAELTAPVERCGDLLDDDVSLREGDSARRTWQGAATSALIDHHDVAPLLRQP